MVRKISEATKRKFFKKLQEKVRKDTRRMEKLAGSKKTRNFLKNLRKK